SFRPFPGRGAIALPGLTEAHGAAVAKLSDHLDGVPVPQLLGQGVHAPTSLLHLAPSFGLFSLLAAGLEVGRERGLDQGAPIRARLGCLGIDGLQDLILEEYIDAGHLILLAHTLTANLSVCQ